MNKAELVKIVAAKTKTTQTQTENILDAVLEVIQSAVKKGDEVKLVGFGSFSRTTRKSRPGRNPKTGEQVKIPSCPVPRFKAGKNFKDSLK